MASVDAKIHSLRVALQQIIGSEPNVCQNNLNKSSMGAMPQMPNKSPVTWRVSSPPGMNEENMAVALASHVQNTEDSNLPALQESDNSFLQCAPWHEHNTLQMLPYPVQEGCNGESVFPLPAMSAEEDIKAMKRILLMSGSTLRAREIKKSGPSPLRKLSTEAIKTKLGQLEMMGFGVMQTPQLFTKRPPAFISEEQCALVGISKLLYVAAYKRPIHSGTQKYIENLMSVRQHNCGSTQEDNCLVSLE